MEEDSCSFLCSYDAVYAWDVECTWLISLIWISGCRQMKGTSTKHKKTQEALWLEYAQNSPWLPAEMAAMAPGTFLHGRRSLQNM
jgi:hypothetical protein